MEGRKVVGWAATDSSTILSPYSFYLRKAGPEDVLLKVLYCGVDHTDLHQLRNEIHLTTYPLVAGSEKPIRAGIVGLGGVGHLGVLIAKAMGHHVTVISSSDKKKEEALTHLGADCFLVSSNLDELEKSRNSLDYILDTVPVIHKLQTYLPLLGFEGKIFVVGAVPEPLEFDASGLILGTEA